VTLDGQDTSFLEWVGAVAPSLARPGGTMHEVAASGVVSELLVGLSAGALCFRLKGSGLFSELTGDGTLALVIGGIEVRVLPIERSWMGVGTIIEVAVPFDRIGVSAGAEFEFALQVRDRDGAVIESIPQGRQWTIAVPNPAASTASWQA